MASLNSQVKRHILKLKQLYILSGVISLVLRNPCWTELFLYVQHHVMYTQKELNKLTFFNIENLIVNVFVI